MGFCARTVLTGARFGLVAAVLAAAAGCSGQGRAMSPFDTAGRLPADETPVSTSRTRPAREAPAVPEPLRIDVDDPCAALTPEQLSAMGITDPGVRGFHDGDAECRWHLATSPLHVVSLTPVASEKAGLSDVYAGKKYQQYFEPTEIDGYPAVYAGVLDQRSNGNCQLWVGVTDELAVDVATHFLETDPCPVAERVAAGMIEHARDGA